MHLSAQPLRIDLPQRPASRALTLVVLACSTGAAAGLFLHDAMWPGLAALLLVVAAWRWRPRNQAQTVLLDAGGACRWGSARAAQPGRVVSVFSAGGITILRLISPGSACKVMLMPGALPAALRSRAGRWLNAAARP